MVLEDVTLEIRPRDFLAIIGPNGGGKTTLVKILLGLLRPWSGEVVWTPPVRPGRMGYVPQFSTFDKDFPLRVADVVLMGRLGRRSLLRPYTREDREDVDAGAGAAGADPSRRASTSARSPAASSSGC